MDIKNVKSSKWINSGRDAGKGELKRVPKRLEGAKKKITSGRKKGKQEDSAGRRSQMLSGNVIKTGRWKKTLRKKANGTLGIPPK